MNKEEFLDKMRQALKGQVSDSTVSENLEFYDHYIEAEINSGKKEKDVIEILGDPRLLAKTIIELGEKDRDNSSNNNKKFADYGNESQYSYEDESYNRNSIRYRNDGKFNDGKYHSILGLKGCLVALLVLFIVFVILRLVLSIAIFFAVPLCIIFLIITLVRRFR